MLNGIRKHKQLVSVCNLYSVCVELDNKSNNNKITTGCCLGEMYFLRHRVGYETPHVNVCGLVYVNHSSTIDR